MPFYALIFVQSYDSLGRSWTKLKYLFMRLFKRSVYTEFEEKKKQMSNKICQLVDEFGGEVVENFKENRIIKPEEIEPWSSQKMWFTVDFISYFNVLSLLPFISFNNLKQIHWLFMD